MQNDDRSAQFDELESRVANATPAEPTEAQYAAVRARVASGGHPRRRGRLIARIASVAVAISLVVVAVVVTSRDSSAPAFAFDSAADAILPQDAVLHAVLVETELPPDWEETGPHGGEVPTLTIEYWVDAGRGRSDTQYQSGDAQGVRGPREIVADGRRTTLIPYRQPSGDWIDRLIDEPVGDMQDSTSLLTWIDRLAQGIRTGDCEFSEETTGAGEAVWRVSWSKGVGDLGETLSAEVVVSRADYRVLSLEYTVESEDSGSYTWQMAIAEWETVAYEDVPAGILDPASLHDLDAAKRIVYESGDPRLTAFSEFPVYYLGEESDLGSLAGAVYETPYLSDSPMLGADSLTFTYGHDTLHGGSDWYVPEVGCSITTYAPCDPAVVDEWWTRCLYVGATSVGSVGDIEYRMYTDANWCLALMELDGSSVTVLGVDKTAVNSAIQALERF